MAAGSSSTAMSFPEYTFDLSAKLRQAARSTLAELEASINRDGYDWLDDYIGNIQAQGRRAPIADLIKTPSRTATAKKTRAAMTATINRAEQVKQFNARLALSPLADKSPNGRQPFSPLRAQSVNSPSRLALPHPASPTKSPLGAKVSKLQLKPKAKEAKPKADVKGKGKAKATKADAENMDEEEKPKKRTRTKKTAVLDESTTSKDAVSTPRKAVRSAAPKAPSPVPAPKIVEPEPEPEPEVVEPEPEPEVVEAVPEPIVVDDEAEEQQIDVDDEPEPIEEVREEPMQVEPETVAPDADTDIDEAEDSEDDVEAMSLAEVPMSPSPVKKAAPPMKMSSPVKDASPIKGKTSSPAKAANPPPAATRQVRSSWLSQALGDRPVPVAQARTSIFGESSVRKSLATGSLKRKSEDGPGVNAEDKQAENRRAEKTARFDSQATDAATGRPASPVRSAIFAARQPGSATSLPASANATTPSASDMRQNPTSVPHDGRKTDKVSRALEELRERTAAAAAAKQKGAAANKLANATKAPLAPASSGGFFRGLGNLGAGLFGLGMSAEDEEARIRREADDRRAQEQAEAELARIMNEMADDKKESPEPEAKVVAKTTAPKVVATSEDSDQMGDVAIVVDDESEDGDDESDDADDSFNLPELPTPDIGDEYDDQPFEDGPTSALGAAGMDFDFESTTPPQTPPLKFNRAPKIQTPEIVISPPPKEPSRGSTIFKKSNLGSAMRTNIPRPPTASSTDYDDEDDEDAMDEDKPVRTIKKAGSRPPSAAGSSSRASVLSQAERIAAKALGVKPATGPVASIQRAAEAAKKEETTAKRQAAIRAKIESRKQEDARRKEEAERQAAEEERKRKAADIEERRRRLAEAEKRRAEHTARQAQAKKEKAAREEREASEARAKAAEEEAARKRQVAALLSKSQQPSSVKRIAQPAGPPPAAPKPLRLSKASNNLASSSAGPSSAPTIKLVQSKPPSAQRIFNTATFSSAQTLQASRQNLVAQLDQKVTVQASEDILLPDIASEYSDSDDSDRETDFKRPAWAESPELKSALERQATLNPDELFGAIRPLNMDELFKQRQGKFRARTSSANWSGADRLTEAEEREYARRMGFKALNAPREGGGSAGDR